jgi:hypothetical protein
MCILVVYEINNYNYYTELTLRLLMSYIYIYIHIYIYIYIYMCDIRKLRVNDLTLILLTWRKW